MDFSLSDDQVMLQDSLKGVLASVSPLDDVRRVADGDSHAAAAIAAALNELGLPQLMVPESHGGLGLGLLDAVVVQEQLGAAVTPAGFLASAVMAVIGLAGAGTKAQQAEWLPKIASGDVRVGVAVMERIGAREGAAITASGGVLNGTSLFALETETATHVLVSDRDGRLHMTAMDAEGLTRRRLDTIDRTRDFTELVFDATPAVLLTGENGSDAVDRMIEAGRLLLAADTLGAAQSMLDKAVAYALERKQFGRAIGSFQAVKHMCAEMAAALEPSRALVWHAAHALDEGMEEGAVMACLSKAHLSETGTFIARTATEVHGGMGFTDLVGLHYWFKRIGANRQLLGSPEQVRAHAAKLQGWA